MSLGPILGSLAGLLMACAVIWFLSRARLRVVWLMCLVCTGAILFLAFILGGMWFWPLTLTAVALAFGQWGVKCSRLNASRSDESLFPTIPYTNLPAPTTLPPPLARRHPQDETLGPPVFSSLSEPVAQDVSPSSTALPPHEHRTLGRYLLQAQIGRGGLGAVYLAQDTQINRQVAIKTLALGKEFEGTELTEARQRFFREAQTAGRLQHPNIVTIFDVGEEAGLAYIAMEYVQGHDLQRHTVPEKWLPIVQVVEIASRIADALSYAHRQGVVHRDVKPANVLVDGSLQIVKMTDFGIARIADSHRTRTGILLGTPLYMSPEQVAGQRVDGRSDLYSLGVMLFQLLTGRLPYQSHPIQTLLYRMTNEPAPDVRTFRAEVPDALARTLAWMLQQQPKLRCADGQELARGLRWMATQMSVQSEAQWPPFKV
jgi:eukaryotic-like serine/threonine-protein kinase